MSTADVGRDRLANWERFTPFQNNAEDWQTYRSFKGDISDSLSKRIRALSLMQLVRQIAANGIKGRFAECGCANGHTTHLIARTMTLTGINESLLVFDSFQGLSAPAPEDLDVGPNHVDTYGQQAALRAGAKMFAVDMAVTMRNLAEHNFITFKPGWIPTTFAGLEAMRFAFVHIDVDLYQPVRDSLNFFYERLAPGGIIQIDDYNFVDWPGTKTAVDEFLPTAKPSFFFALPLGGAFLIK